MAKNSPNLTVRVSDELRTVVLRYVHELHYDDPSNFVRALLRSLETKSPAQVAAFVHSSIGVVALEDVRRVMREELQEMSRAIPSGAMERAAELRSEMTGEVVEAVPTPVGKRYDIGKDGKLKEAETEAA